MAATGLITLPYTPGWDLAGIVVATGLEVANLRVGQRVFGLARFPAAGNAYADYAIVPAVNLMPTPATLTDLQAGALPMAAMTAWQAFTDTTTVGPGQRVLITGAGGGIGHLAVQIAKHLGATVTAIAHASKHEWLRTLGANLTIDYRAVDTVATLADDPVDVALSLAAGSRPAALGAVRPGGVLIALGEGSNTLAADATKAGIRFAATHVHAQRTWLQAVTALAANRTITPTVSEIYPLTDAARAHRAVQAGHSTGKVVLRTSALTPN